MSYLHFSTRIANYLVKKNNLSKEMEKVLAYAIEVLSLNLLSLGLTLLIGYILGVTPGTIACLLTVAAIRIFAGGAHSDSPWRCVAISALIFPALALTAHKLAQLISPIGAEISIAIVFISSLWTMFALSPVESPNAPIIAKERRKKLKIYSIVSLTIAGMAAILIRYSINESTELQLCIAFGILWSSFILTSIGHRFLKTIDRLKIPIRREVKG